MRRITRKRESGFSLTELSIVVAIIGVLASVAVPAFRGYIRRSKTSEVGFQLDALFKGAQIYARQEMLHIGPAMGQGAPMGVAWGFTQLVRCTVPSSARIPAVPSDNKQQPEFTDDPSFVALGFGDRDPVYYSYQIVAGGGMGEPSTCMVDPGPAYTFLAIGDLNGDGVQSRFELATAFSDELVFYRAPFVFTQNELE